MKASALELIRVLGLSQETDLLLIVKEQIRKSCPLCLFDMADAFEIGAQYLASFSYDLVILDFETDRRYELLKRAFSHKLPVILLMEDECHPKTVTHLIMSGVQSFLPKSKIAEIVPARHDLNPGGGAQGLGITMFETHTCLRQLVQNRRFVRLAAVTTETFIAEIVGHDENDVGP